MTWLVIYETCFITQTRINAAIYRYSCFEEVELSFSHKNIPIHRCPRPSSRVEHNRMQRLKWDTPNDTRGGSSKMSPRSEHATKTNQTDFHGATAKLVHGVSETLKHKVQCTLETGQNTTSDFTSLYYRFFKCIPEVCPTYRVTPCISRSRRCTRGSQRVGHSSRHRFMNGRAP